MVKISIEKEYVIDIAGNALITRRMTLVNNTGTQLDLRSLDFVILELTSDAQNISVVDGNRSSLRCYKRTEGGSTLLTISPDKKLSEEEKYEIICQYALPNYVVRINHLNFIKETFSYMTADKDASETQESKVVYHIPSNIPRHILWKKFNIVAPKGNVQKNRHEYTISYEFTLTPHARKEIEIGYWTENNTLVVSALTAIGGIAASEFVRLAIQSIFHI